MNRRQHRAFADPSYVPTAILTLAARRLEPDVRADLLDEWKGELHEILHEAASWQVLRLWRGLRFSLGLLAVAPRVGTILGRLIRARRNRTLGHLGPAKNVRTSITARWLIVDPETHRFLDDPRIQELFARKTKTGVDFVSAVPDKTIRVELGGATYANDI
jgi:hypothetical protein